MSNQCSSCDQMKKENKQLRFNRDEIHKNYLEVIQENIELRKELERLTRPLEII